MGASIDKLGNVMLDLAEFRKDLSGHNGRMKYFLVGVDCLSQLLACVPLKDKKQTSWELAIRYMIENNYPFITTIITDRDVAISGQAFQREVKRKYGINWIHLRSRSKAYKAERMIRFLKTRLSTALLHDKNDKNWVQHLPGILNDYNSRYIQGTNVRRRDACKENYMLILAQKYGVRDPTAYFNTSVVGNFSPEMASKIFKFAVGSKVLLATSADYSRKPKGGVFEKKSVTGSYGKKVYTVEAQYLKSNSSFFLNIVYRLVGLKGLFYENELIPALFSVDEKIPPSEHAPDPRQTGVRVESREKEEGGGGGEEYQDDDRPLGEYLKIRRKAARAARRREKQASAESIRQNPRRSGRERRPPKAFEAGS
jgi:hypothetical protein